MVTYTEIKLLEGKVQTPVYVYDLNKVRENFSRIKDSIPYGNTQIFYAMMANYHPRILMLIKKLGGGVQVNSWHELELAQRAGFETEDISFTSTGLDKETLENLVYHDIQCNLDSIEEIDKLLQISRDALFGIRLPMTSTLISPQHPRFGNLTINTGIDIQNRNLVRRIRNRVKGVHGYLGTNITDPNHFLLAARYIVKCAGKFPALEYVNLGGGFGIDTESENPEFDFSSLGEEYTKLMKKLSSKIGIDIQLRIEPGRALVASCGTLYTKVTNVKRLKDTNVVREASIDAGFGEFARPYVYGARHRISLVGKGDSMETYVYRVRGNTCLQEDFISESEMFPEVHEGDVLAIHNVGAYGRVMASGFPGKTLPKEIVV